MGLGPLVETKRLEIQIEQLEAALAKAEDDIATLGTVEIMVRNPNVDSWVREHEERLAKAEAERDEAKRELGAAVGHVRCWRESVIEALNKPPEYWYDKNESGLSAIEHAVHAIETLFAQRDSERARADRYLAAMQPVSSLDAVIWCDIDLDRCRIEIKWSERQAIRAIIKEARK